MASSCLQCPSKVLFLWKRHGRHLSPQKIISKRGQKFEKNRKERAYGIFVFIFYFYVDVVAAHRSEIAPRVAQLRLAEVRLISFGILDNITYKPKSLHINASCKNYCSLIRLNRMRLRQISEGGKFEWHATCYLEKWWTKTQAQMEQRKMREMKQNCTETCFRI